MRGGSETGEVVPEPGFELDHVFVVTAPGAPSLERLRDAGFHEGPPNTHPGQGTACRRVFFGDLYLELIWLTDRSEATSPPVQRTALAARTGREPGASRIGLALRARARGVELPVDTWPYSPPYLPDGLAIPVAANSTDPAEPLLFFMPWERRWSAPRLPHPNGATATTAVSLTVPSGDRPSAALRWLRGWGGIRTGTGPVEALELVLDGGAGDRALTLEPEAPLTLRW